MELKDIFQRGAQRWPGLFVDETAFTTHIQQVIAKIPTGTSDALTTTHIEDLYLAFAAGTGDSSAIAQCEIHIGTDVDRALIRIGLNHAAIDEVRQQLRTLLYVKKDNANNNDAPYIANYNGRGRLAAWVQVIAVRLALKTFREQTRLQPIDQKSLAALCDQDLTDSGPEQKLLRVVYGRAFRQAFQQAATLLSQQDRTVLLNYYVDGHSIDQLAATLNIHRATAARWVKRAEAALMTHLRQILTSDLNCSTNTYRSIAKFMRSHLDLSLRILLTD